MKTTYLIKAREKFLSYDGNAFDAYQLVQDLREVYEESAFDMPKVLNDFVFNIEVELQNIGFLDEHFNEIK